MAPDGTGPHQRTGRPLSAEAHPLRPRGQDAASPTAAARRAATVAAFSGRRPGQWGLDVEGVTSRLEQALGVALTFDACGGGNGGVAGTAQGGSGGSTMIMCNDPGDCPPAPGGLPVQVDACCTPQGTCGVSSSLIGGGQCIEGGQPGQPSTECMDFSQGGFTLKGCCRPDGTCGILDTFLGLGCVDPSQFGAPGGGGTCTP